MIVVRHGAPRRERDDCGTLMPPMAANLGVVPTAHLHAAGGTLPMSLLARSVTDDLKRDS